jgi:hypothetical protein
MVAALAPVLALSGCSSAEESDVESHLSKLPGVSGAFVWTTTSGLPTNRGYAVRLYVGEAPPEDLSGLLDEALRTTWTHAAFDPTNGIGIQVSEGERPEEPSTAQPSAGSIDLFDAVQGIPWEDEAYVGTDSTGTFAPVPHRALEARYGTWSNGG